MENASTVEAFANDLKQHGGDPARAEEVCIDMKPALISGIAAHLPHAHVTFDKFNAVKIVNEAVDLVSREEQKGRPELNHTRYVWLKNETNLSSGQRKALASMAELNLKTARAYQIRLNFQAVYTLDAREQAETFLSKWYFWATHSRLPPMIEAARTIIHQSAI